MIAQLEEDLVHLERGGQRLDQDRHLDRAGRDRRARLRVEEDLVPEPRLEVALHLRQVEVRAGARVLQRLRRCERGRGRSRTACPAPAGRRRRSAVREDESRADAPSASRAAASGCSACRPPTRRRSSGGPRRSGCAWPSTRFAQVGDVASSKSAMNTFAPEFSALMIILRSTGPVISTRRSCRSAGNRADLPVAAANGSGVGEKIGTGAGVEARLHRAAALEQLVDARPEAPREIFDEGDGGRRQDAVASISGHKMSARL